MLALVAGLVDDGWNVIVVCEETDLERELRAAGVRHVAMPVAAANPLPIWLNGRRLAKLIVENNVRLVHAHDRAAAWAGALGAKKTGASFITTLHGLLPKRQGFIARRYNTVMTAGDRTIVGSDYLSDALQEQTGIESSRLRIIRPGVDLSSFDPANVRGHRMATLSERWQLSLDHKIVMAPGSVTNGGGQLDLIKVMQKHPRRDWQLLMIGELDKGSVYLKAMERAILEGNLADRVIFGGSCDDMAAAYMMADLVAITPETEHELSYLAVQAQAMGRPVMASNCGDLAEALMPAATGWLVGMGDHEEMARSIDLALNMPQDVLARLSVRARSFAAEEFSVSQMLRRTSALYRELVRDAPRPRLPEQPTSGLTNQQSA